MVRANSPLLKIEVDEVELDRLEQLEILKRWVRA